jgi:hypothetical protein
MKSKGLIALLDYLEETKEFSLEEEKNIVSFINESNLPLKLMSVWAMQKFRHLDPSDYLWRLFLEEKRDSFFVVSEIIIERECLLEEMGKLLFDEECLSQFLKFFLFN